MATKYFCDRCGKDITGRRSGSVQGISDADADGNGTVTDAANHLCLPCYRVVVATFRTAKPRQKDGAES